MCFPRFFLALFSLPPEILFYLFVYYLSHSSRMETLRHQKFFGGLIYCNISGIQKSALQKLGIQQIYINAIVG